MSLRTLYDEASLWMTPSGYEDGKLFSELPTDGSGDFTFSRGSNLAATRVGPTGLIEKGRENLLLQSNNFSNSTWDNYLGAGGSITGGQLGYDGSNDAWLIEKQATTYRRIQQSVSVSGVWTMSVYAKAGTTNIFRFRDNTSANMVEFDLSTGIAINTGSNAAIDVGMENVGNDWYRCYWSHSASISTIQIYVGWAESDSVNIYIQDAQLEIGLAATEVISTGATTGKAGLLENEPRLDYSGGATCPSLLLEPSRTQLFEQSEYFGGWAANPSGISSIESNYAISPEGLQNAYKINFVVQSDSDLALVEGHSVTGGSTYAYSIYIKGEGSDIGKDIVIKSKRSGGDSAGTTTFQTLTGEWKRIDFTATYAANNTAANFYISSNDATSCLVYGAQAELGSYPTSYIPNHSGGAVTRVADNTGAIDVSSLGVTTGYTLFYELGDFNVSVASSWLAQGGTNGRAYEVYGATPIIKTTLGDRYPFNHGLTGTGIKVAVNYDGTNINVFTNGTKRGTWEANKTIWDALTNLDMTLNNLQMVNWKQLLVFPTALTDSECIKLTTI